MRARLLLAVGMAVVAAGASALQPLRDDLREEPPLERFQPPDEQLPALPAAARMQADADLVSSRAQLRAAAGQSLLENAGKGTP